MIIIFDYFNTIVRYNINDFNRGLKIIWEKFYQDKCSFEEMAAFGEELFKQLKEAHKKGREFAFVKDELPAYAEKFGGDVIPMSSEEEADFIMTCNELANIPGIPEALLEFDKAGIPMYVLSNSMYTAGALSVALERLGIRKYFKIVWSSADFGRVKPERSFFEMAVENVLSDHPDARREDIVFIGDTYGTDVIGANNAGLDVIWINRKAESNADNLPVHCIYSTGDMVEAVTDLLRMREVGEGEKNDACDQ